MNCKACLGSSSEPGLAPELEQDRDIQQILSNTPFNAQVDTHRQILETIYAFLTGDEYPGLCMMGAHWERIGFQSTDPAAELNVTGCVLNLVHWLYLIEEFPVEAKKMYASGGFPFAASVMAMSAVAYKAAMLGKLNKEYNRERMVIPVTCRFFVGLLVQFAADWKEKGLGLNDLDNEKILLMRLIQGAGEAVIENLFLLASL